MPTTIRASTAHDGEKIALLSSRFADYLRSIGDPDPRAITAEQYRRDGFGDRPAFSGLVAEVDGETVGFLLYHDGYDIDRGGCMMHVIDLFVEGSARRQGVGRSLMEEAAKVCSQAGGHELVSTVYVPNEMAHSFYVQLGAHYQKNLVLMDWPTHQ